MRILCGPENLTHLSNYLYQGLSANHDVLCFNDQADRGIRFSYPHQTFQDVLAKLPPGWEPDLVIWWFPEFHPLLEGVEDCPYPTLLAVSDWHVTSQPILEIASAFDLVATDRTGLNLLSSQADVEAFYTPLYGFDPNTHKYLNLEREVDIGHVGDVNPALQKERVNMMCRAAALSDDFKVQFDTGVFGDAYVELLNKTRITLNHTLRKEMSMRCYEAPACGSLLFCEETNQEVGDFLVDGEHCVLYNAHNLESKLREFAQDEEKRFRLAMAGYERIQNYTYEKQMSRLLAEVEARLKDRPRRFRRFSEGERRVRLAHQGVCAYTRKAPLMAIHQAELALKTRSGGKIHNILGVAFSRAAELEADREKRLELQRKAEESFRRALPYSLMVYLNLAHLYLAQNKNRRALRILQRAEAEDPTFREVVPYAPPLQEFWCSWEREREERENLTRWYLFQLLAQLEPERQQVHLEKALQYHREKGQTWYQLSRLFPDESEEKVEALLKVTELEGHHVWARVDLARCLWSRGRRSHAEELLSQTETLLNCMPFPDQARQFLDLVRQQLV